MDQFNYCYGKFKKELKLNKMEHERFVRTDKLLKHNLPVIIAKKRGALIKGGEVDYDKTYKLIIKDLKDGKLGNITFDRI